MENPPLIIPRRRNPFVWIALIALTVVSGLASRYSGHLPRVLADYSGDTPWALAAFLGMGLVFPRASTWRVALLAFSFSILIEAGQLYHAPWIDSIRRTTLGGLVLGFDFVWSDLDCYSVGVGLGILIEMTGLYGRSALLRGHDDALDHDHPGPLDAPRRRRD